MDRVVWIGCALLFFAGGIYFNILPSLVWKKEVSVADVVAGISAIAAAFAAYASWKAANISKRSAEDSKLFTRAQLYMSHRQDFTELLDYIASELKVVFYRKNDLYYKLFPRNHYSGKTFEAVGQNEIITEWSIRYSEIVSFTEEESGDADIDDWIIACSNLSDSMNFAFPRLADNEPELYLYAFSEPIQTQFSSSPARPVFLLAEVMNHIFAFCACEKIEPLIMDGHPFETHYLRYFNKIKAGHRMHYITVPSEEVAP
jgi:hypothetical protein